jgi:hypothetical protein
MKRITMKILLRLNHHSRFTRWLLPVVCCWYGTWGAGSALAVPQLTSIARKGNGTVTIIFSAGTLMSCPTLLGPWIDVAGATSPYTMAASGAAAFFRLRGNGGYSVNTVGYVNIGCPAKRFILIHNPLSTGGNTIAEVLPSVPDGTVAFKYSQAYGLIANGFEFGAWTVPTMVTSPGDGFFVQNNGAAPLTLTFVGEVTQGTVSLPFASGWSLVGSKVPQPGKLVTDLGYPVVNGTTICTYDTFAEECKAPYNYTSLFGWIPSEPIINVGEAFWSHQPTAGVWTRQFTVR